MNPIVKIKNTNDLSIRVGVIKSFINAHLSLGDKVEVEIRKETRSKDQNAKLWPMLKDLSQQVEWDGEKRGTGDWKDLISAVVNDAKVVNGLDGGLVRLGLSTSKMSKKLFSEMLEFGHFFGDERGVNWSKRTIDIYEEYNHG